MWQDFSHPLTWMELIVSSIIFFSVSRQRPPAKLSLHSRNGIGLSWAPQTNRYAVGGRKVGKVVVDTRMHMKRKSFFSVSMLAIIVLCSWAYGKKKKEQHAAATTTKEATASAIQSIESVQLIRSALARFIDGITTNCPTNGTSSITCWHDAHAEKERFLIACKRKCAAATFYVTEYQF